MPRPLSRIDMRAIHVNCHINAGAKSGQIFVHRIIQYFSDAMMQSPLIRPADIHPGLLSDSIQPLQFTQLRGTIFCRRFRGRVRIFSLFQHFFFRHNGRSDRAKLAASFRCRILENRRVFYN